MHRCIEGGAARHMIRFGGSSLALDGSVGAAQASAAIILPALNGI
jgi:hypothetical protein